MKYGLLYYKPTGNIGDDIQSLAARQFLPHVDVLVDREKMRDFKSAEQIQMILNGWYMCEPQQWPPSDQILPLLTSMHITNKPAVTKVWFNSENRKYLLKHSPIGARDAQTLALLKQYEIPAFFSGCQTLTLRRNKLAERGDYICAVDVGPQVLEHLRRKTDRPVIPVTHWIPNYMKPQDTFVLAEMLLDLYQRAHCVITSRLHAALPCLALKTPVLLMQNGRNNPRFEGLNVLTRFCPSADYLNGKYIFDLDYPGENPQDYLVLRDNLIERSLNFIGPEGEKAYAAPSIRVFEGLLPVISLWEEQLEFQQALIELSRGRFYTIFKKIKEFYRRYKQNKRN